MSTLNVTTPALSDVPDGSLMSGVPEPAIFARRTVFPETGRLPASLSVTVMIDLRSWIMGAAPGVAVTVERPASATAYVNGGAGFVLGVAGGGGQGEPDGLSCPTLSSRPSANHRLLSGPVTIPLVPRFVIRGSQYSFMVPPVVIRPILSGAFGPFRAHSLTHSAPSGPFVMS